MLSVILLIGENRLSFCYYHQNGENGIVRCFINIMLAARDSASVARRDSTRSNASNRRLYYARTSHIVLSRPVVILIDRPIDFNLCLVLLRDFNYFTLHNTRIECLRGREPSIS